jgi:Ca2+-binding RTX toxin-like protein
VTVDLLEGFASGGDGNDTLSGLENIIGSAFSDTLMGNDTNNFLVGNAGDDLLDGRLGFDFADYRESPDGIVVDLTVGTVLDGFGGTDSLSNIEEVIGSGFADIMNGGAGGDILNGFGGSDELSGGAGPDDLFGGAGDDVLDGGIGMDELRGGVGADQLTGGGDADIFVLEAGGGGNAIEFADILTDFDIELDKIGLLGDIAIADITIGETSTGAEAVIFLGSEFLAVVEGIAPELLTVDHFINVV